MTGVTKFGLFVQLIDNLVEAPYLVVASAEGYAEFRQGNVEAGTKDFVVEMAEQGVDMVFVPMLRTLPRVVEGDDGSHEVQFVVFSDQTYAADVTVFCVTRDETAVAGDGHRGPTGRPVHPLSHRRGHPVESGSWPGPR